MDSNECLTAFTSWQCPHRSMHETAMETKGSARCVTPGTRSLALVHRHTHTHTPTASSVFYVNAWLALLSRGARSFSSHRLFLFLSTNIDNNDFGSSVVAILRSCLFINHYNIGRRIFAPRPPAPFRKTIKCKNNLWGWKYGPYLNK